MEETTSLDGLDTTLAELGKIAEGADIVKALAGAVDTTGHMDERGKTPGTLADESDAGELDSMMIGKMRDTLIAQGFDAGSIAAFMRGKMDGDGDEDEDEDGDEGGGRPAGPPFGKFGKPASSEGGVAPNPRVSPKGGGGSTEKSLSAFRGNEQLAKAMDVSPFLNELVATTSEMLDEVRKSVRKSKRSLSKSLDEKAARDARAQMQMAKGLMAVVALAKSQEQVIAELGRRLNIVERTPLPAKGRAQLPASGGNPLAKSGDGAPQLTKEQAVRVLSYVGLEKSGTRWATIGGQKASEIATLAEAGASLTKSHVQHVLGFLAAHPAEAQTALNYR